MPLTDRILTTHVGSLPRPTTLLDQMKRKLAGNPVPGYPEMVAAAVAETVDRQIASGIDIVSDGEMSKPGFFTYVQERLAGFAPTGAKFSSFKAEMDAFPEYYADYFARAMNGGAVAPIQPMTCVGPVSYRGREALAADIANLKAATAGKPVAGVFMPSVSPNGVGTNSYYKTQEEFLFAVADALRVEYLAIIDAGFTLQVDEPFISHVFVDEPDPVVQNKTVELQMEAINHAIRGIPHDRIRLHNCYGINEGPRIHEATLAQVLPFLLKAKVGTLSFEGANCRHEHEYHLFERINLPDGMKIAPGVITHASNIVEHPELIAERLMRYIKLVGRENVIASSDCGFSSQACYKTEVDPRVMWAKFQALAEGARLASEASRVLAGTGAMSR
ncbi:MAG TPA: cobalamin-independent methionine synthase II family protein [Candidatus Aquilonibacter sp.]